MNVDIGTEAGQSLFLGIDELDFCCSVYVGTCHKMARKMRSTIRTGI
jgi:hypothetical protein